MIHLGFNFADRKKWEDHCCKMYEDKTWYKEEYTIRDLVSGQDLETSRTPKQIQSISQFFDANQLPSHQVFSSHQLLLLATQIGDITHNHEANNFLLHNLATWLSDPESRSNISGRPFSADFPSQFLVTTSEVVQQALELQTTITAIARQEFISQSSGNADLLSPASSSSSENKHSPRPNLRASYLEDELVNLEEPDTHFYKALTALGAWDLGLQGYKASKKIIIAVIEGRLAELRVEVKRLKEQCRSRIENMEKMGIMTKDEEGWGLITQGICDEEKGEENGGEDAPVRN